MFSVLDLPMEIEHHEGETPTIVRINPQDIYPVVIARIQEVLNGAMPIELFATSERGGTARADVLINNARKLPPQAWSDALLPRTNFIDLSYSAFVRPNGGIKEDMVNALESDARSRVLQMLRRGYALEIAYGWFCQALRLAVGSYDLTINRDENYRL